MNERREFEAQLFEIGGNGSPAWTVCELPFSVKDVFGKSGYAKIKGQIDGLEIEKTLMPAGQGKHFLVVSRDIQKQIGKKSGDSISVILELNEERIEADEMGIDFELALENAPESKAIWHRKSPSHRREILKWINEAKQEETRMRRIDKAISDFLSPKE